MNKKTNKNILIMSTGATMTQTASSNNSMKISKTIEDLTQHIETPHQLDSHKFNARSGAHLTFETTQNIVNTIKQNQNDYNGFVLITGTDSMEELAFFMDLTLKMEQPIVLTGSMKPHDIIGYDGLANLEQAIQVAGDDQSQNRGVLVAINDSIHLASLIRKTDSQLMGAFESHPGPVGQIRQGQVVYYYDSSINPFYYDISKIDYFKTNIPILTYSLGMPVFNELLDNIDGLVIAGMGTASIPDQWIEQLSFKTETIPIVLVSRCTKGTNYDDYYYKGSLKKYENKGFILQDFKNLNAIQARIKLILDCSIQF